MARYRKIAVQMWNDARFRSLSDSAKLAFVFMLTHQNLTSIGAMRATLPGLAAELDWTAEAFREAFGEALSKGMVKHDEKASLIALPNFLKHNPPESPNVVKSWASQLELLPQCPLQVEYLQRAKGFVEGLGEAFAKALPEAFAKGMPSPEPEPEPVINTPPTPKGGAASPQRRALGFDPLSIEPPSALLTDRFRSAWGSWVAHRGEIKKPLTKTQCFKQLDEMAAMGEVRAVAAINHTILKGWIGLKEPEKDFPHGTSSTSFGRTRAVNAGPGQTHQPKPDGSSAITASLRTDGT